MSDVRSKYERWTKSQLVEHAVSTHRDRNADQRHRAEIKRDLERSEALRDVSIKELDAWFGAPLLRELILSLHYLRLAGEALGSVPTENTMRVTHPDSSRTEGLHTRRYRELKYPARRRIESAIKKVNDVTESIGRELDRDEDLTAKRRFAALRSHHARGLHVDEPDEECSLCERVESA